MSQRLGLRSLVLISFFFLLFITGCVTKSRYIAEVDESNILASQLQAENEKSALLQEEKRNLRERLEAIRQQANSREMEQETLLREQNNRIVSLEKQKRDIDQQREKIELDNQSLLQDLNTAKGELSWKNRQASTVQKTLRTELEKSMSLQKEIQERGLTISQLDKKSASLKKMLAEEKKMAEQKIRDTERTTQARKDLIDSLQKEIEEGNIKISQMEDRLSVQIVNKVLFPTGSDQVSRDGKGVLKKVSNTLKRARQRIRIEGHTDNVPIGVGLIQKFPSNWELSTSRATQVVRYLVKEKVNPENLQAVGMSEYKPIASNDTPEGRQQNRRIEIILTPK